MARDGPPPDAAGWDTVGHGHLPGCSHAGQVMLSCVPTGGDGRGTALLPPGTQGGGGRHRQGPGAASAESQVCGPPPLPPQLVGPMGSPNTLGETLKNAIPAGTLGWSKLPEKRAFWPGPVQTWADRVVVAPAWWWVLPHLHRDLLGASGPALLTVVPSLFPQ